MKHWKLVAAGIAGLVVGLAIGGMLAVVEYYPPDVVVRGFADGG